jgi:hypothetical protein
MLFAIVFENEDEGGQSLFCMENSGLVGGCQGSCTVHVHLQRVLYCATHPTDLLLNTVLHLKLSDIEVGH